MSRQSAMDEFGPRQLTVVLDNSDARFSPRNTAGPYSPNLVRGKRVQLQAQITIAAATNLLTNPSFEVDATGWSTTGGGVSAVVSYTSARWGGRGWQLTELAAGGWTAEHDTSTAPTQSLDYTASIYARALTGDAVGKRVRVVIVESGGAAGDAQTVGPWVTLNSGRNFHRLEVTRNIVEADRTKLIITFERDSADYDALSTYGLDGAMVEQASSASAYVDGDRAECSWAGTAHASQSTRVANPTITIFTGELRTMSLERQGGGPGGLAEARFELTGITESARRTLISAGPFARDDASPMLTRVMDILDEEQAEARGMDAGLVLDGANRIGADAWVTHGTNSVDKTFDTGAAGDDPIPYGALEGDQVVRVHNMTDDFPQQGAKVDLNPPSPSGKKYRTACFVKGIGSSIGLTVKSITGGGGGQGSVVLSADWQYMTPSINGVFGAGVAGEYRIIASGAGWDTGGPHEFYIDCAIAYEIKDFTNTRIMEFATLGTHWTDELEYIDAFNRSANAVLDEIASSVGGWLREDGAGGIVFEDYSRRNATLVPTLRLSDHFGSGYAFTVKSYVQPMSALAGTVKVGSFGDVTTLPAANDPKSKHVWTLEPHTLAFAADAERVFFADHVTAGEADGGLIARRSVAFALPVAAWGTVDGIVTPWVKSYGRSSTVTLKDPGGARTLKLLLLYARPQHRERTERTFVRVGSGDPELQLDMPAQGDQTAAMTALATWAEAKYSKGPATLEVEITGDDDAASMIDLFTDPVGKAVWLEHLNPPGQFSLGISNTTGTFFCEGFRLTWNRRDVVRLQLRLEEG